MSSPLSDPDEPQPPSPPEDSDDDFDAPPGAPADEHNWNGPKGWGIYFPGTKETDESCKGRSAVVKRLYEVFITEPWSNYIIPEPSSLSFNLDYHKLTINSAPSTLRSIAKTLTHEPDMSLSSLGLAACRAIEHLSHRSNFLLTSVKDCVRLQPRIANFHPVFSSMSALRSNLVGRFVSVKGTVIRVSNIRQQLTGMKFRCNKCGEQQFLVFRDYRYSMPQSCMTDRCRSRSFTPIKRSARTVDWQRVRVQELQKYAYARSSGGDGTGGEVDSDEGRIPKTIDAELFSDLIDSCVPGDTTTVTGILKIMTLSDMANRPAQKDQAMYYMYIEANAVSTARSRAGSMIADDDTPAANTVHTVIHEVVREDDPFGFLVHSAVPSIFGHELVKAGLLLALFGGAPKLTEPSGKQTTRPRNGGSGGSSKDNDKISIRRDAHVLVVGDPGLGKSQMLKAFCNLAPRGVYVSANTASTTGLTVTVVRDAGGDFALEAGALVLADGGACCIDEFDKMTCDHGTLLEAMEQQSVSVAKAGLLCNLSARTTVLAAANPVSGHYDRAKTVCENLKLAKPLLSRFDLIFILVDRPDVKKDRFISEHVMKSFARSFRGAGAKRRATGAPPGWRESKRNRLLHGGAGSGGTGGTVSGSGNVHNTSARHAAMSAVAGTQRQALRADEAVIQIDDDEGYGTEGKDKSNALERRLQGQRIRDPLPPSLFREYVLYARTHVHPALSTGARAVLQGYYLALRRAAKDGGADTTPVTTRQLESMIRLAEARARAVMRTVVTATDASDVVEIMRKCLVSELTDADSGTLDFGRASGMSKKKEADRLLRALHAELARHGGGDFFFTQSRIKAIAKDIGVERSRVDTVIDALNDQGFILRKGPGKFKLSASMY